MDASTQLQMHHAPKGGPQDVNHIYNNYNIIRSGSADLHPDPLVSHWIIHGALPRPGATVDVWSAVLATLVPVCDAFPDARLFLPETELFAKELPPSNLNTFDYVLN